MAQRKWWRETQQTTSTELTEQETIRIEQPQTVVEQPQTTEQQTIEQQNAAKARRAVLLAAREQVAEPLSDPLAEQKKQGNTLQESILPENNVTVAQPKRILTQGTEETLNAATLDAWAEAENEVLRRNQSYSQGEVLEITANYLETRRRTTIRSLVLLVILSVLLGTALALPLLAPLALMFGLLLLSFLWMDVTTTRALLSQVDPILTLSPEGITIRFPGYDLGLLRWEEMEEISPYKMGWRYLSIRPKDPLALVRRLGWKRAYGVWLNYGGPGKQPAIVLPEECLPLPIETIMKRIAVYEQNHVSGNSLASVPASPNARPSRQRK